MPPADTASSYFMTNSAHRKASYRTEDFNYTLPPELIAQSPVATRDESRLLVLNRQIDTVEHKEFRDIVDLGGPGDLIVVNSSRVIPARLHATRDNGRTAEVLLVHQTSLNTWRVMVHPGGKLKVGRQLHFESHGDAEVTGVLGGGLREITFDPGLDVNALMADLGSVPLPPYIHREPEDADSERYQTIFAIEDGSVAAPTAGLHFTPELVTKLKNKGIDFAEILLHVGPGTFKPVAVEDPQDHEMHSEWYSLPEKTARLVNRVRESRGRVWAVGSTAARVLEICTSDSITSAGSGWTSKFIFPPYEFEGVDVLITNFHQPRSSLLMLVTAFGGYERVMAAYDTAIEAKYRFYSYGDAMVIV